MSFIPPEIINRISAVQSRIWQTVGMTTSESCGHTVNFQSPLTVAAKTADLYSEFSAPMMVVQFAFAGLPENSQVILIPQETVAEIASVMAEEEVTDIDENVVSEIRSVLEGMVQGICLAVGNLRNETVVASGLNIRFQIFSFPINLQRSNELVRTQVALTGDDELSGTAIWLADNEVAHMILGLNVIEEADPGNPFGEAPAGSAFNGGSNAPRGAHEDHQGIDILLDIPLEISVELGRVKMLVRDVLELGNGSIVEIDKAAGEPVDVLVNGRRVAQGEVVVIEDNFGVRITAILNPYERLGKLGDAA